MTEDKSAKIENVVRAIAFPALISIIGVYLYGSYQKQEMIYSALQDIRVFVTKVDGRVDGMESAIHYNDKRLDDLSNEVQVLKDKLYNNNLK